jgi:hypothetical protein
LVEGELRAQSSRGGAAATLKWSLPDLEKRTDHAGLFIHACEATRPRCCISDPLTKESLETPFAVTGKSVPATL